MTEVKYLNGLRDIKEDDFVEVYSETGKRPLGRVVEVISNTFSIVRVCNDDIGLINCVEMSKSEYNSKVVVLTKDLKYKV